MLVLAIVLPGIYFFVRGKIISGIIATIFHIAACFLFVVLGLGFVMWAILSTWATISYMGHRNETKLKEMEKRIIASNQASLKD